MNDYKARDGAADTYSLRGKVFHKLREDILSGKYEENEELREAAIGEELGVSRTPVREALRQLELEGLIRMIPNKGAYVTGITLKDVQDIYMMRSMLEGLCARWAARNITQEQLNQMEENIYLSEFHQQRGDTQQFAQLDNQFHEILYEACDSKMLRHTLRDFHEYVYRVRRRTLANESRIKASTSEHRLIMEAIKNKDEKKAEELANQHMINAYNNMLKNNFERAFEKE